MNSKLHRLTKSPLTQPLPACCTLSLQYTPNTCLSVQSSRGGWVSGLFVRRWGLLSVLQVIYIL